VIDLELIDTFSDGTVPSKITKPHPVKPDADLLPRGYVLEAVKPFFERLATRFGEIISYRIGEGLHGHNVAHKLQIGKNIL
jgi:hypothetical protein